jgi:CubicO group peptidase (beta-lactamase class C family)
MHLFKRMGMATLLLTSVSQYSPAQSVLGKDTVQVINSLFSNWNDSTAGGNLAISRGNEIIFSRSFGEADLEHKIANTSTTVFEAGSVSKQFTAAALLLLIDDKKISLDDDVSKYIPELPDYGTKIKVSDLLHHTSGIKDWSAIVNLSGWPRGTRAYTQAHVMDIIFRQKTLNFKPGTKFSYSNSNYNLLVMLVERVSGKKFTEFTRDNLFVPLGMSSTQWRDDYRKIVTDRAIAYSKAGKGFIMNMPFENNYGHGGLLTTTGDMLKWNDAWFNGKIRNKNLTEIRQRKGVLENGEVINYAAGVFVRDINGKTEISHSGSTAGYRSWLAFYPELQLSIAYLSNDGSFDPERLGEKLKDIFLGKSPAAPARPVVFTTAAPAALKEKAGAYKKQGAPEIFEIEARDTGLFIKNGPQIKMGSKDSFYVNGTAFVYANDQIHATGLDNSVYKRMQPSVITETGLTDFAGIYYSEEAESEIRIDVKEGKVIFFQRPNLRIPLSPVYKDAFFLQAQEKLLVEFVRGDSGLVTDFMISLQRAENIRFKKITR